MNKSSIGKSAATLVVSGLVTVCASAIALAENSLTIQDFEMKDIAINSWGSLQSELVEDEFGNALHVSFEEDADPWCGIDIPVDEFSTDYDTLRLKFKGSASKKLTYIYLYDSGGERYSTSYIDKTAGWSTVEIPLKRFAVDSWQPDTSDKNKKKDYPFKYLQLQRNGNAKGGNDFYVDELEVVKK